MSYPYSYYIFGVCYFERIFCLLYFEHFFIHTTMENIATVIIDPDYRGLTVYIDIAMIYYFDRYFLINLDTF